MLDHPEAFMLVQPPPAVLKRATSEHAAHVLAQEDSVPSQFVDPVLDDGQSPSPKLQLLVCHKGGRVGGAFKRLMLLTAMHGAYRSRSAACHSFKYRKTRDHHYQTVWVLDDFGVKNLDEVISYAKNNIVALFKPNPTDIISGAPLPPSAFHSTRETRMRAVFALGVTPLAMLIDESLHTEAQLLTLWEAVIALCDLGPASVESADVVVTSIRAHLVAMNYEVTGDLLASIKEPRVSRGR